MKRRTIQGKIRKRIILLGITSFLVSLLIAGLVCLPSMRERADDGLKISNEEIIKRLDSSITFVENYTENLALSVQQNENIQRYFADPTESNLNIAMLTLNNLTSCEGVVRAVFLEVNDHPLLDSLSRICDEDYALLDSQWYQDIRDSEFCRRLSKVYTVNINHVDYTTVAYARNFFLNNRWCTFVAFTSLNGALYDARTIGANNNNCFLLRDATDSLFYAYGDEKWVEMAAAVDISDFTDFTEMPGGAALVHRSIKNGWCITSFVSTAYLIRTLMPYLLGLLLVLVSFLVLMLVVLSTSLGKMLRPVAVLAQTMDGAAKGNLEQKVEVTSDDEIGLLQQAYNRMLDDLHCSIDLIAEKDRTEQQIKFNLLVSQIDPHFICNTINSVNYLARRQRCGDVITVNTALMAILRDRLRVNDIEITDTVSEEMRVVKQYLKIQRFMYCGDLQIVWDVAPELLEAQIPKNMIQPLIENALFHGLIDQETGALDGEIRISLEKTAEGLLLTVRDNGAGMEPERLEELLRQNKPPEERGNRIGLSNIRSRLYYLYGTTDCLKIESALNQGTTVTILFRQG